MRIDRHLLFRILEHRAGLLHGDTLGTGGAGCANRFLDAAATRAEFSRTKDAKFVRLDVRLLQEQKQWHGYFDVALCLKAEEHLLDDAALLADQQQPGHLGLRRLPGGFVGTARETRNLQQ
ncbi:hypothetical protein MAMT_01244 [Methylacidimicrobium tartarophylax]|uniref:Uncharacterized protein n=1 Tax=Methylacidimicrobium tartarophylax TaxID=1041768 RepID=A0A5E6MF96_9BACT|nr:hypothetical protein MAMT_01244 [Methylacidimicrobium tartarophylax]